MKDTKAIVFSYPDHRVSPALLFWLLDIGIARQDILFTRSGGRDVCTGYNFGIRSALESDADSFIFADNDIVPDAGTTPEFFATEADLVCAKYDIACDCAWKNPLDFHTGLWRASRSALETIGLPAFRWPQSADGARLLHCPCTGFARRARKLGLKTAWGGEVGHAPSRRDGRRDVLIFPAG